MIPLTRARLCIDCDTVYDGAVRLVTEGVACPACGSAAVMPISCWLNRVEKAPRVTAGSAT